MIVFCEECGEKYIIEAEDMKSSAMIFICNICSEIIHIPAQETPKKKNSDKKNNQAEKVEVL